ncbi:MAG: hypothetical protein QOF22_1388 [Bradyrhizobium sp.]|nr:hypothetical protein [Bradyrhizobium sp.]
MRREQCDVSAKGTENVCFVMPGLGPGIHVFLRLNKQDVDGRDEPGHDGNNNLPRKLKA